MKQVVQIFDTTLRDGEQAPGCTMLFKEKMGVLDHLRKLNVDVIEAGFPGSSVGDLAACKAIAKACSDESAPVICGLSRLVESDLEACVESLRYARRKRIHAFMPTSEIHLRVKKGYSVNQGLELIEQMLPKVAQAANSIGAEWEFSCEDATRSDKEVLRKAYQMALNNGAKVLNVPDTVGHAIPWEYGPLFEFLLQNLKTQKGGPLFEAMHHGEIIMSAHGHNDLGNAVANFMAAILVGARQIQCTINGIGERTGNGQLEAVVAQLKARRDVYQVDTNINLEHLMKACEYVEKVTSFKRPITHPVTGVNAFAHEAGIHSDAVVKDPLTYELFDPKMVGNHRRIIQGKHAGRRGVKYQLEKLGLYHILADDPLQREDAVARISKLSKEHANQYKEVSDLDFLRLVAESELGLTIPESILFPSEALHFIHQTKNNFKDLYEFDRFRVAGDTVTVFMKINGQERSTTLHGVTVTDGIFSGIVKLSGFSEVELTAWKGEMVTQESSKSVGEVYCELRHDGDNVKVLARDSDKERAFAQAVTIGLNRLALRYELAQRFSQSS